MFSCVVGLFFWEMAGCGGLLGGLFVICLHGGKGFLSDGRGGEVVVVVVIVKVVTWLCRDGGLSYGLRSSIEFYVFLFCRIRAADIIETCSKGVPLTQ